MNIPKRYDLGKMGPVGGQGSIIHARDKLLNRPVVMKAALPGTNYDIAAEVRSLAAINSKHVVALYDTINDAAGNIEAIVEEEVEGDLLSAKFAANLTIKGKLRLLYQIACGVTDMHSAGRVHRDLKPSNMKVRPDGLLKIFDFGISTVLASGDETQIGKGTRGYKAPELCGPPPMKVSMKCDIYSLGVIAHQFLSGGVLDNGFQGKPPDPTAADVSFDSLLNPKKRLTRLLNRCLANDPKDRPAADELRDALAAEIVRGQHRAVLVSGTSRFALDSKNSSVKVGVGGDEITVEYTGTRFVIRALKGDVYVNNRTLKVGDELSGAMVFTLGAPALKAARTFVTFDISRPEILV